jgi:hypothetical protein
MVYGEYDLLLPDHEQLWAYTQTLDDTRWLVVLNVAGEPTRFDPPARFDGAPGEVVLSNYDVEATTVESFEARPWEARVYALD